MKQYNYSELDAEAIRQLVSRNALNDEQVNSTARSIISKVKAEGDAALYAYSEAFDKVKLSQLFADKAELQSQAALVDAAQKTAIDTAYDNICRFHASQQSQEAPVETTAGVVCWREARPIESVGLYVPGGNAVLPSTLMMLGIPAVIAGCSNIVICTPPQPDGLVNPFVSYVALKLGQEKIYTIGGAQSIAAMAYGTASIPAVDKIFGPGNRYVTAAKTILQSEGRIAIDMPAGPSEVLVIADESAEPAFVAADLLSQAEHGSDSQAILVSTSSRLLQQVGLALTSQLQQLPRASFARTSLNNSYKILCNTLEEAMSFSNQYAPEHLILNVENPRLLIKNVRHAGSVFVGPYTPESAGDYASGTNHTLPTSGCARAYSGVSLDSFIKKITFQEITTQGIQNLGPAIVSLAEMEGLEAHARAVKVRLEKTAKQ